jgi:hypothetical protein
MPNQGDQTTIGGKLAVWDGSQWQTWDGSKWAPVDASSAGGGNGGGTNPYVSTDPNFGADTYDLPGTGLGQYAQDFTPDQYRSPTTPTTGAAGGGLPQLGPGMSRDQVQAYVQALYAQKGVTPNSTDVGYWTDRYFDPAFKGDYNYWNDKLTNQNESFGGGGAGNGAGGNNTYGGLWQHMPSLSDIQNIPGYQAALAEGRRSYETGAAAKGTILNGRTIAGEGNAVANQVLSQFYFPFAQQQYQNNQGNANNLYNLSNLGLNASSVGPNAP